MHCGTNYNIDACYIARTRYKITPIKQIRLKNDCSKTYFIMKNPMPY